MIQEIDYIETLSKSKKIAFRDDLKISGFGLDNGMDSSRSFDSSEQRPSVRSKEYYEGSVIFY